MPPPHFTKLSIGGGVRVTAAAAVAGGTEEINVALPRMVPVRCSLLLYVHVLVCIGNIFVRHPLHQVHYYKFAVHSSPLTLFVSQGLW